MNKENTYQNSVMLLLSLVFGCLLFDRMTLNFLVPFFDRDIRMNNLRTGILMSVFALAWAVSGYLAGKLSDKYGHTKKYLVFAVVSFSLASLLSGLATNFTLLLLARILMGFASGPVLPLSQSIILKMSSAQRRGLNMGVVQNLVSNTVTIVAPLVIVAVAIRYGWR